MIGRLKGILLEKQAPALVVDVNGVGYELAAPMTTFYRLPSEGSEVTLYTHFVVREDAQLLYGFYDQQERLLFRTLIKVNGVGPKLALTILSGMEADIFVTCVNNNDVAALCQLPGVGKKTAERLLVEVRDKLKDWQGSESNVSAAANSDFAQLGGQHAVSEATSALVALGYKPQDASRYVAAVEDDTLSSEELIRQALKGLVKS